MNFILLVVGPTCSGKNTIIAASKEHWGFKTRVSCTTRAPKAGESNGIHYHFISHEEFERRIANDDFAEWAQVHGNYYGTLAADLEELITSGQDVVFDIDVRGALQLADKIPQVASVFILPPSYQELEKRMALRNRGESEEDKLRRFRTVCYEIGAINEFDYVLVNKYLEETVNEFVALMRSLREGGPPSSIKFRNPTLIAASLATFPK